MKKRILFICGIMWINVMLAQHPNITITGSNNRVEPSIILDPRNTNHMVAGSNHDVFYFSKDGGVSWESGTLEGPWGVYGDPCVVVDTLGRYYFFHLTSPIDGSALDRMGCQSKDSIGAAWDRKTYFGLNGGKAQDKEWAVVCPFTNNIYVSWTQFDEYGSSSPTCQSIIRFTRSTDQGQTWMEPVRLNTVHGDCVDDGNTVEGAVPAVGPNGEVYVVWAGPDGIRFNRSLDHGLTWLQNDILVNQEGGYWNQIIPGFSRCNGFPVVACDISGGVNNGTIYVNWTDQRNGEDDTDVWLSKSMDGGNTWSGPIRVNDDPPGKHQFLTWMAIDQVNGNLYFVFYDRRNHDGNTTDVYLACSRDGGQSFINTLISESPIYMSVRRFMGDYNNISAHNNVVRPIWVHYSDNVISIRTSLVNTLTLDVPQQQADLPNEMDLYPNPFSHTAYTSFKMRHPGYVTLKVFDTKGAVVATIYDNQWLEAGRYLEKFDAVSLQLGEGVYFFRLITPGFQKTQKIIFQK